MPSGAASRTRRVDEDEVMRRWSALGGEQRRTVMSFDDVALVKNIRDAVQALYEKQVFMARLGMRGSVPPDLFLGSSLLEDVFELKWNLQKSEEFPDAVLMDPEDQEPYMNLRRNILEGDIVFNRLRKFVPDLLGAKSGRTALPRAKWKQLFKVPSTSVESLELQLIKLVEQALWAMGSNPVFEMPTDIDDDAATGPSLAMGVPLDEDWMDEPVKVDSKSKKKKIKKKAQAIESAVDSNSIRTTDTDRTDSPERQEELEDDMDDSPGAPHVECQETLPASVVLLPPRRTFDDAAERGRSRESFNRDKVLNHHYWKEKDPPFFQWCLPLNPLSRGFWKPSKRGEPGDAAQGLQAVVRNTFIELDEPDTDFPKDASNRLSRSLSPSMGMPPGSYLSQEDHVRTGSNGWYR